MAVTDHGMRDFMCYNPAKIKAARAEVDKLRSESDLKLLLGIENDIIGTDGEIDLQKGYEGYFDLMLMGFHFPALPKDFKSWLQLYVPLRIHKVFRPSKERLRRNTLIVNKAIVRNKIDVLSHINYNIQVDVKEVAKCCADNGVLIELNCKHIGDLMPIMDELLNSDVRLIADTDAHKPSDVGDFHRLDAFLQQYDIGADKLVNLNETVIFPRREAR